MEDIIGSLEYNPINLVEEAFNNKCAQLDQLIQNQERKDIVNKDLVHLLKDFYGCFVLFQQTHHALQSFDEELLNSNAFAMMSYETCLAIASQKKLLLLKKRIEKIVPTVPHQEAQNQLALS